MTKKPIRQTKFDRLMNPGASEAELRCDYAVAPFDRVALDMERIWGIDRLEGQLIGGVPQAQFTVHVVPRAVQGITCEI